jgi:hypothetical protein
MREGEIIITDFIWRNPPRFTDTPHFIKIHRFYLRFRLHSLYTAIFHNSSIKIYQVDAEGLEVYLGNDCGCPPNNLK